MHKKTNITANDIHHQLLHITEGTLIDKLTSELTSPARRTLKIYFPDDKLYYVTSDSPFNICQDSFLPSNLYSYSIYAGSV